MPEIILVAINAKWIHPSLALRLLKANLGPLEERCHIIEFALRQPLREKLEPILRLLRSRAARPRVLGISVAIWNHGATLELLRELERRWGARRPVIVLGGPEVSHLPPEAEIFRYADYVIRGEGEIAFRELCERIFEETEPRQTGQGPRFIDAKPVELVKIKSAYHLYSDEDISKKLIYVEASRGCPFNCAFCLSAVKPQDSESAAKAVREFPLEPFLQEMDELIRRAARIGRAPLTFKFLDRTFNLNIERARRIMEFFLEKIEAREKTPAMIADLIIHFEMVPSRFPPELRQTLARFPPGSLRLEIGIQTLNPEVSARINRTTNPEQELAALRFLREKTSAIMHVDLIAGLPGEDLASFGKGFDRLWEALLPEQNGSSARIEIQLGILKLLPGAPIARHTQVFGMRCNPAPPYEVLETAAIPARDLDRVKNFARFWELIVNRALAANVPALSGGGPVFDRFMALSDSLLARFGRNWGIDKNELRDTAAGLAAD